MTQYSMYNETGEESPDISDKHHNGLEIEEMVANDKMSYIEATTCWLESNSLPATAFSKYIPNAVIDKIKVEAKENNTLRPSLIETRDSGNIDFLL